MCSLYSGRGPEQPIYYQRQRVTAGTRRVFVLGCRRNLHEALCVSRKLEIKHLLLLHVDVLVPVMSGFYNSLHTYTYTSKYAVIVLVCLNH